MEDLEKKERRERLGGSWLELLALALGRPGRDRYDIIVVLE
jgi:hypothetical protein